MAFTGVGCSSDAKVLLTIFLVGVTLNFPIGEVFPAWILTRSSCDELAAFRLNAPLLLKSFMVARSL